MISFVLLSRDKRLLGIVTRQQVLSRYRDTKISQFGVKVEPKADAISALPA